MAEAGKRGASRSRGARQKPGEKAGAQPVAPANETASPASGAGSESLPASSASPSTTDGDPGNPLGLEDAPPFVPPERGAPTVDEPVDELPAEPPQPIDWTPERAGALVRAGGFLLHNADPLGNVDGGEHLWRATLDDVDAIAPPLARILNRYAPARRLAGMSDEVELTIGLGGYARRNLADRGRLVRALRSEQAPPEWPERGVDDLGAEPGGGGAAEFGPGYEPPFGTGQQEGES